MAPVVMEASDPDEIGDYNYGIWDSEATATETATITDVGGSGSHNSNETGFDAQVFWSVNAFILTLLLGMCIWCCCFGGKRQLEASLTGGIARRVDADLEYQEILRQRRDARMAARRSTPTKRTAILKRSFVKNKVQMVVKEGDIIEDPEKGQRQKDDDDDKDDDEPAVTEVSSTSESESEDESNNIRSNDNGGGANTSDFVIISADQNESDIRNSDTANNNTLEAMEEGAQKEPLSTADVNTNNSMTEDQVDTCTTADADTGVQINNNDEGEGDSSSLLMDNEAGYLVLRPGDAPNAPKGGPMVPNCCAVCLGDYEVDDTVVWSCHKKCRHAFHQECIMEWLVKIPDGGTPCPCCRQEFTDWETQRQNRKIKWAAGSTFDLGSIALR